MKHNLHTFLLLTIALLSIQISQAGEMRLWKSAKGSEIKAELLFMGETLVVLKTEKGKEISIPITSLGAEATDYLSQLREQKNEAPATTDKVEEPKEAEKEMVEEKPKPEEKPAAAEAAAEVVAATGDALETLKDGPGKGMHAYYEGEKYIAELQNNGTLYLYHKDKEGKADRRWKLLILAKSIIKTKNGWKEFAYEKILKGNPAKKGATEVEFTFQSETGIISDVIYEFTPKGITTWTRSEEGPTTPEDALHAMSHHIVNINQVSKDKTYLRQIKLKQDKVNGEKEKYDFNEAVNLTGDTKECEITGPFLDKTKIQIERGRDDEARLTPAQYPEAPLSDGFSMNCIKTDCTSKKHNAEKTTILFK